MKKIFLWITVLSFGLLVGCTQKETDNIKPIILVSGGTTAMITSGEFTPPSVVVSDNQDSDITVVVSGDTVNVNQAGTYTLKYNATDKAGNTAVEKTFTVTIYDYAPNMDIQNGGFETGDLAGWTIEQIGGSSDAFKNEFVISTNNRKEGTYFFDGSKTDDDKVGSIRSSNFVLGGSGWIHFRLGGGNDKDNLYLAVYRASDDSMVARFANSNPQKYGGNEFLVGYKFNLLSISGLTRGETLYIKVVDTKLENWAIIKIDDIKTFTIEEPTSNTYDIASNQIN